MITVEDYIGDFGYQVETIFINEQQEKYQRHENHRGKI